MILDKTNDCADGVIDGLSPNYGAALILLNLRSNSGAETGRSLDISVEAAKVRIHRARARLKEALNRMCDFYTSYEGKPQM